MEHHDLDIYPIPREKTALYINEPWLIDKSIMERVQLVTDLKKRPDEESDNIRIYVPLDLNRNAILRRLDSVIYHYGETNEENELDFSMDIEMIISQIEIYDQVWFGRHMPKNGKHSLEAKTLVREFVERLEEIPDGCAGRDHGQGQGAGGEDQHGGPSCLCTAVRV